jgi:LacI family transcriptional regulator
MVRSLDVAERAGVSRATVSLVLSGRDDTRIPETTRARVLQIAQEMGYRPHRSGRAVRSGKTGNIALLLSTVAERSLFSPQLLDGLMDAAAEHDQHLLISRVPDDKLSDSNYVPKILKEFAADGVILNYNSNTPPHLAGQIAKAGIPAIWINDKRSADCVYPDDFAAARDATLYLIAQGHTRIGYAGWTPGPHYSMADRLAGYQAALKPNQLLEILSLWGQPSRENLFENNPPTAVLCYSPHLLPTLWSLAPKGTEFVVFHSEPYVTLEHRFLTWLLPDYTLGKEAVSNLIQKISTPSVLCAPQAISLHPPKSVSL